MTNLTPYQKIKNLALQTGQKFTELLAMSKTNDPFYIGSPSDIAKAEWFAELWERFSLGQGVHLRRIHYLLFVQSPPIIRPDGKVYGNTDKDWAYLNTAAKAARYLKFVPIHAFIDRRNSEAIINRQDPQQTEPGYNIYNYWEDEQLTLPQLPQLPNLEPLPYLPEVACFGYEAPQKYHLEVLAEKSAINDIVLPICAKYGVNYQYGMGELSITTCVDFLERLKTQNQLSHQSGGGDITGHIFYISDYDKAGQGMPVSIATKIQYFQKHFNYNNLTITVQPLVLTPQQVVKYNLPRKPGKYKKEGWSDGVVELDALEALVPGELAKILENAILEYYDTTLVERGQDALADLQITADNEVNNITAPLMPEIDQLEEELSELEEEWQAIQEEYTQLTAPLTNKRALIERKYKTIIEQHQQLNQTIIDELQALALDYPDIPTTNLTPPVEHCLYNSKRNYFQQLKQFKSYREKTNGNIKAE